MNAKSRVAHIEHEVIIVADATMGYHLLQLLVDDLWRSTAAPPDWLESVVALTCYVHDALPEELRIPVPTIAELRSAGLQRAVA